MYLVPKFSSKDYKGNLQNVIRIFITVANFIKIHAVLFISVCLKPKTGFDPNKVQLHNPINLKSDLSEKIA